ncbi:Glu/Leu/Phe/Val dehydrogenase family protein [Corynebacterium halotolerans]|uniref:Phenylalanine dehydrogenase n=1 Tax=Corynebacterium halotolerans YIM 70093 = DSM 44683 TaxID=1121362 RepID=M1NW97_9CORY|nr:Glu/Leu/Phe/Val dehydrogenase family protein [Corynebacterium halotolerans]AGF73762.1 phenylalanine dehydrogenase [Corynebacterium halotolerans YIM 70093 = DSM 44683]
MDNSIFTPLEQAGLTTLKLQYNWRTDEQTLHAAREWDEELDFSRYNQDFTAHTTLTPDPVSLGTGQVHALFAEYGLSGYLEEILDLLRQGRHEGIEVYFHRGRNIRFMCHQHSRTLGLRNRHHAIMAGGTRRHDPETPEIDVIIDGLNLGRAMSFKNIAAGLNFGGCKTTVHMDEPELDDLETLGFLAFAIDRCRTMTSPDMSLDTAVADVMNEHFSSQFTNGPSSPIGESGTPTALGSYLALKEAVRFQEGSDDLRGKSAVIMGLGAVGWYLAAHLIDAGAALTVSDLNPERVAALRAAHPDVEINAIGVDEVLSFEADILCPSAIGGILDEETINQLRYAYVFGPANNQIRATNQAEELRLAQLLADRGILFQTEWWHNTGGVMGGAEEYLNGADSSPESLRERVMSTVPRKTRENLEQARELGITPTANAYRQCTELLFPELEVAVPA